LLVSADTQGDWASWGRAHRDQIESWVTTCGAVLFRGLGVSSVAEFEQFIKAVSGDDWVEYREAATPRSLVQGHIFTSTEYDNTRRIYLHNENSHVTTWPGKLFFYCEQPSETLGATPLADCRRVFARIDPDVRERFLRLGWQYRRNFGYGLGFSWQQVFKATTRQEVETYCRENQMSAQWHDDKHLTVRYRRGAAVQHPRTKEWSWFNHGTFYNTFTVEPALKRYLAGYQEHEMPYQTYYGDGEPIPTSVMAHLDAAYQDETVVFPWQRGDLLMVDNMLVAHGRQPYTGERRVYVGMTQLCKAEELMPRSQYALA
jgi:alpha-ketoglutarate-dependent taurine dioxygenase